MDPGTSAIKLLLVDGCGEIVRTVSRSYPVQHPNPGWSEQDPECWWNAFLSGVRELTANIDTSEIEGIGKRIVDGSTSLAELAKLAEDMGAPQLPSSRRQEYLQGIVNVIMFR